MSEKAERNKFAERIVERIRKLLAVASDQTGRPEGEVAAGLARKLMVEHDVTEAHMDESAKHADDPLIEHKLDIEQRLNWKRNLAHAVARHCEVFSLHTRGTSMVKFYGRSSSCALAEYLFTIIVRQIDGEYANHVRRMEESGMWEFFDKGGKRHEKNKFCTSAGMAVNKRLTQMRKKEETARPEAFALVHQRFDQGKKLAEEMQIKWRKSHVDPVGFSKAGYSAGERVALHDALEGRDANLHPKALTSGG